MSQRHGRVQRQIIVEMMKLNIPMTVEDLCPSIYDLGLAEPSDKHLVSVRRALKLLEAEKIVRRGSFAHSGLQCWVFIGGNADRTGERLHKLRAHQRRLGRPKLVEPVR